MSYNMSKISSPLRREMQEHDKKELCSYCQCAWTLATMFTLDCITVWQISMGTKTQNCMQYPLPCLDSLQLLSCLCNLKSSPVPVQPFSSFATYIQFCQ